MIRRYSYGHLCPGPCSRVHTLLPLAAIVSLLASPVSGQQPGNASTGGLTGRAERPTLRIRVLQEEGAAAGALRLDGVLDEPAWSATDSIPSLTQIEPQEGAAPAVRTVVRVIAEADALVFGIRADYPPGVGVVSFARQRDAGLTDQDHAKLVLDTYLDGRSGYVFAVNPTGARYDALVANRGEGENAQWDGIWEAATARTSTGWSAEIRIPVQSLLFRQGLEQWGFNVQLRTQALLETDRWASPERDYRITQVSRAGLLTELPPFDLGLGLSVRPSVTAGLARPGPAESTRDDADVSLDATQRLGGNTLASLTVNTDFAETEVDARRTNLTRFPLFFPEKRTFFLEGAEIFDFGLGLGEEVRPFHSRRIGLLGGREVPLDVGGKVNGQLGGTSFGAIAARTGRLDTLPTQTGLGVLRVKQNVLQESTVGMIATVGDPLGRAGRWTIGPDVTYQTSRFRGDKNFLVGVWGLATGGEGLAGRTHALGAKIDYPNDLWDIAFTYKWLGDGFEPALGFVPRAGVQITTLGIDYLPRPRRPVLGLRVRQMVYELRPSVVTDLDGRWESYRIFTAPINWRLESGDRFEFNVVPTGERLLEPFEIADGVTLPAGPYHWNRYRLEAGLAAKRRFSGQLTWWFGDFYTGRLDEYDLTAAWKPSPLFIVELTAERNAARLREGRFTQDLVGTRLRVNVSPDLQVTSYVQYDNQSESFGTNTRLRWTFSPLGDLFVVYNHNLSTLDPLSRDPRWAFASNELLLKLQYAFRY